ncbi:MAG: hypothetical protein J6A91_00370 [Bacteroidales bacterium]|nr:hypothetical protein [Bacteroidales bacterium]
MRRLVNIAAAFLVVMSFFSSCRQDEMEFVVNESIVIDIVSGKTKSVADLPHEYYVEHIDVLIFNVDPSNNAATDLFHHERFVLHNFEPAGSVTLNKGKSSFEDGAGYYVYLLANTSYSEADMHSISSWTDFSSMIQTDEALHMTGLDVGVAPKWFLMDGVARLDGSEKIVFYDASDHEALAENIVLTAELSRAAAKVQVQITADENIVFSDGSGTSYDFSASEGGLYYIRNMPYTAFLSAAGEEEHENSYTASLITTGKTNNSYLKYNPGSDPKSVQLTVYVYPHRWENMSELENEPNIIINLPLIYRELDGEGNVLSQHPHPNSWYKLPMSKGAFERNRHYMLSADIHHAGATTVSEPVKVDVVYYEVSGWDDGISAGWEEHKVSVSESDRPKYLTVNQTELEMNNITVDDSTLEFYSSSEVSARVVKVYYYDKFGVETDITSQSAGTVNVSVDAGLFGNIAVSSPLPANNTAKYILIEVTNEDGSDPKQILVRQNPLEYIDNIQGYYSYRDDFLATDGSAIHYENFESPYYTGANWGQYRIQTQTYSYFGWYTQSTETLDEGWVYGTGSNGTTLSQEVIEQWTTNGTRYRKVRSAQSASAFFLSKVVTAEGRAGSNYEGQSTISYYYYNSRYSSWRTSTYKSYNSNDPGNARMYHVRISASSGEYALGIPKMDTDGFTDAGSDNAALVSPSFMIASQLGAVYPPETFRMAAEHCRHYVETYKDGDQVKKFDDWRLPTRAEIEIIMQFQYMEGAVIDEVLAGDNYYCADGGTVHNYVVDPNATSTNNYVRCVRDAY